MQWRIVTAAVLALGAVPLAGAGTLGDALELAYRNNPELNAERERVRAADERVEQARSQRRPALGLSVDNSWTSVDQGRGAADLSTQSVALSASQSVYRGGRINAAVAQAQAGVQAAREGLRAVEQRVLLEVVAAYMDVRRDDEAVRIRDNNVRVLRRQLEAAQARFDAGEITRTDVRQAEARLAGAEASYAAARAQLEASRAGYERVVGGAPETLAPEPPAPATPGSLGEALLRARDANPQALAARHAEAAARQGVRAAAGALLPEASISARMSYAWDDVTPVGAGGVVLRDRQDSATATARISVPLYEQGFARSAVRGAKLDENRARYQVDDAERAVAEQVTQAWHAYAASKTVIEASTKQVVAAQAALEGVEAELQVGQRTTLDVLDAEQELLNARLALVRANRDSYVAAHALLAATGGLTPDALGLGGARYDPGAYGAGLSALSLSTDVRPLAAAAEPAAR